VRWLEKRLNFTGIDKYHGTGAFDHSKFPEWNSIFLEYVDHPEEIVIIEIRQRRRQRKLSGFNDYFDSLTSSSSGSSSTTSTSTTDNDTDTEKNKKKTTPWKPKKITNRKLSDTSNYLETMSSLSSTPTSTPQPSSKTKNQNKTAPIPAKTTNNKDKIKSRNNQISKKKYLDIQGSSSSSSDSSYGEKKERRPTEKQSTKLSNNPFLDEKPQEYELSIDPPALVRRILSVREQLSKEWVEDLELLIQLNDDILDTFEEYTMEENSKEDDAIDDDDDENNAVNDFDVNIIDEETDPKIATIVTNQDQNDDEEDNSNVSLLHSDLDLLEKALDAPDAEKETISDPSSSSTSSSTGSNPGSIVSFDSMTNTLNEGGRHRYNNNNNNSTIIFDRNVVWSWTQSLWSSKRNSSPSSPYRKSNFDLLLLLSTQESVHRVLNSYRDSSSRSSNKNDGEDDAVRPETFEWLLEFYKDHVMEYFDGHQTYARSEDFLEKMLTSPRTLIETKGMNDDDDDAWVDPARIAEDIVRERCEVALNWIKISENVLKEHTDLRRLLFTNTLSKSPSSSDEILSETIRTAVNITEVKNKAAAAAIADTEGSSSTTTITEAYGAFE